MPDSSCVLTASSYGYLRCILHTKPSTAPSYEIVDITWATVVIGAATINPTPKIATEIADIATEIADVMCSYKRSCKGSYAT